MTEHSEGVEELVDALLEGYAPISVIFDHMLKAKPQPTVNDVRSALGGILKETLQPLATRFGSHDLLTTAAVIEATVPLVHEDIHLVSHDFTEGKLNRRERRRRSRGGELLPATTKEVMDALPKPSG